MMLPTAWQDGFVRAPFAFIEAFINAATSAGASVRQAKRTEFLHANLVFVLLHDVCASCLASLHRRSCTLWACLAYSYITGNWNISRGAIAKWMAIAHIRTARRARRGSTIELHITARHIRADVLRIHKPLQYCAAIAIGQLDRERHINSVDIAANASSTFRKMEAKDIVIKVAR